MKTLTTVLTVGLIVAACAEPATLPERQPRPTAPSTTTTTRPAPTAETDAVPCTSTPPLSVALLCEAYELVSENYMDPVDPAALAAAASLGILGRQVVAEPESGRLICAYPTDDFKSLCDLILSEAAVSPLSTLVEAAVEGMFNYGLDPFSTYLPPDLADEIGEYGPGWIFSLGLVVGGRNGADEICRSIGAGDCMLVVLAVFRFGAGDAAGIVVGDEVVAIDGEAVEGKTLEEITALLSGAAGASVEVALDRPGGETVKTLTHEALRFGPGDFEMLTSRIAYIRLNEFSQISAQLTGQVLQLDEVQAAGGIVLDLRDNPGGLVYAAMAIASQFLDGGVVMREVGRDESFDLDVIEGGLATGSRPRMAVLVNGGSASASEVVAAVLQERDRATVIGTRTFGKNLVQLPFRARNGGQFVISIARWTTPGGLDIGITGLQPDIVVEPASDGSDPALERAVSLLGG